jgi:hypothetical protein
MMKEMVTGYMHTYIVVTHFNKTIVNFLFELVEY